MRFIPNLLGILRILLVPFVILLVQTSGMELLAALVFSIAATTDFLDGRIARRLGMTSKLGALIDLVADKLLISGTLFALVSQSRIWLWAAVVIVFREIAVMGLRTYAAGRNSTIPASPLGKGKMVLQSIGLAAAILFWPHPLAQAGVLGAVLLTVLSGLHYFLNARPLFWKREKHIKSDRIRWLPGPNGQVPGTDRPWQEGDCFELEAPGGLTMTGGPIRERLAESLNEGFRWKKPFKEGEE